MKEFSKVTPLFLAFGLLFAAVAARAQSGNSGSIQGVVKDPSGSAVETPK